MKGETPLDTTTIIVTCSAGYETYSFDELKKFDSSLTNRTALDAGVYRVKSELSFSTFSKLAQSASLIFTRHIQPVDDVLTMSKTKDDLLHFIEFFQSLSSDRFLDQKVAIQVRRSVGQEYDYTTYGVKEALDPFLSEKGAYPVIQEPDLIISIFLTGKEAYFGISNVTENLSDWPGGIIRFRRGETQVSRSRFKLEEACIAFNIPIQTYKSALDLGAAPGGWTSFLLDQGLKVTSVDTGELDPQFLNHPNLTFINKNADNVNFDDGIFNIITCDMSWDPIRTAKIVQGKASSLKEDGIAVVTIKLMHKKIRKTIDDFLNVLASDFEAILVKQLFHNRDEVTAYLRKNKTEI